MTARRAGFRETDVTRAIRGAKKAGCIPRSAAIDVDGKIVMVFGDDPPANVPAAGDFDAWKAKRDARRAQGN